MANESSDDRSFDLDRLQQLVEMMEKYGLSEVNLKKGDEHWRLRRGASQTFIAPQAMQMPFMPGPAIAPAIPVGAGSTPIPATASSSGPAAAAPSTGASPSEGLIDIKSPTVGTFYMSPSPGEAPFVTVGSVVTPETIVCLVEAMKVFNQIPAEVSGTIAAILVKSGDAVEFGQPLFRVKP